MIDPDLIQRKLTRLNMYLDQLMSISGLSFEDYRQSFIEAADVKLISRQLADDIKGSAGMRNVIVHEYVDIDDHMVYESIPMTLKYYNEYFKQVFSFIQNQNKSE